MSVNIVIPAAGESVTSGVLSRWVKKQGDYVKRDETVLELETDKVNLEVPAPAAGVLSVSIAEGATVTIGQVVGAIDEKAAAPTPIAAAATPGVGAPAAPAPVAEPKIAEPKPVAAAPAKSAPAATQPAHAGGGHDDDVRATPLARKLADELHVDISRLLGTGPGGRIREQDVLAAAQAHAGTNGSAAKPMLTAPRGVTRERMSPLRQRIAQRLVQAQHTAAMLTTFNECDMTAVMDLRKQYKEEFEKKHAIGLGFMGFFVKAVVSALQAYPLVNASIVDDEQGQPAIEKHAYCDVAVAVSTPKGLTVPVLRDCQDLSVSEIEKGIKELATKARDGKLTLEELQGGTFTITNGGIYGSLMSTPILNPPQSAILGMHAIKNRAVEHPAGSGQVAIRPMMYLAVSYDHRIIDGAQAVQFLVHIKNAIENPTRLLLEI